LVLRTADKGNSSARSQKAEGRRQEAGGRRQEAEGRRDIAGTVSFLTFLSWWVISAVLY
jgi:hypothetical protein